jgi:hypothetical protein
MRRCMLTTFDNPYDLFEQFTSCFLFDVKKGYDSSAYLGGSTTAYLGGFNDCLLRGSTTTASNYFERKGVIYLCEDV